MSFTDLLAFAFLLVLALLYTAALHDKKRHHDRY